MDTESPPGDGRRPPAPLRGAAGHITTQPPTSDNVDNTSSKVEPSSFGLSPAALRREIRRCRALGWYRWEIRTRFVDPSTVDWRAIW